LLSFSNYHSCTACPDRAGFTKPTRSRNQFVETAPNKINRAQHSGKRERSKTIRSNLLVSSYRAILIDALKGRREQGKARNKSA